MKHIRFWLAIVNLIYCIATLLLIIIFISDNSTNTIIINKAWVFALMPLFFNLGFVFVIFYSKLMENEND